MARTRNQYLHLTDADRDYVAHMAVARYNVFDNDMQREFDTEPNSLVAQSVQVGKGHAPFEGQYAEELVAAVLAEKYGKTRPFREGWGVPARQREDIVKRAVAYRKELVRRGLCRERAIKKA